MAKTLLLGSRPGMAPAMPSPFGTGSVLHEQTAPISSFSSPTLVATVDAITSTTPFYVLPMGI